MASKKPVLGIVAQHRVMLQRARAEKSRATVSPTYRVVESQFRTVLSPKGKWPHG